VLDVNLPLDMSNKDTLYQQLVKKQDEVSELPMQDLGLLTKSYKQTTGLIKSWPIKAILPSALILALIIYLLFQLRIISLTSVLQHGF